MMWYYPTGGLGAFWMAVVMFLFWGGLIVLAVVAVRALIHPRPAPDGALDVLRRRLAAGEITAEEFERTKKTLGA
jgi:putative membrane protein